MEPVRLATPEEIKTLMETQELDLGVTAFVVAFPNNNGPTDFAVVRQVWEIDPLVANSTHRRKLLFTWTLENSLRLNSIPAYYFEIDDSDIEWQKIVEKFGAKKIFSASHTRYKKVL